MPQLKIDLRDGFADDAVVIRVDGREVYRNEAVSTRMQIGRAASLSVDLADSATVEIALPKRQLTETIAVDNASPRHLGISIGRDGRISHQFSEAPFRYL